MLRSLTPLPCDHDRHGRYCSKCGQEVDPPRLTFAAMVMEFQAVWLQRGFRSTIVGLMIAPGVQIRHYLRENRNLLVKPVNYLIVMSAFHYWTLLLHSRTGDRLDTAAMGIDPADGNARKLVPAFHWIYDHFYMLQLFQAAVLALMLRFVFFRRSGATLPEFTIAMTFLLGQSTLINGLIHLFFLPFGMLPPSELPLLAGSAYTFFGIVQLLQIRSTTGFARVAGAQVSAALLAVLVLLVGMTLWLGDEWLTPRTGA